MNEIRGVIQKMMKLVDPDNEESAYYWDMEWAANAARAVLLLEKADAARRAADERTEMHKLVTTSKMVLDESFFDDEPEVE